MGGAKPGVEGSGAPSGEGNDRSLASTTAGAAMPATELAA